METIIAILYIIGMFWVGFFLAEVFATIIALICHFVYLVIVNREYIKHCIVAAYHKAVYKVRLYCSIVEETVKSFFATAAEVNVPVYLLTV